jgi:acetyltransferase-like isoleucine patch superfamily enzyme
MRNALLLILGFWPIRKLLSLPIALSHCFGRLLSLCHCAIYVPSPHRKNVHLHWTAEVKYAEKIEWGQRTIVGPGCTLGALGGIIFGDDVHLSKDVVLETAGLQLDSRPPVTHIGKSIRLGNRVWIGAGAIILGGVEIGDDAVIGAGAVVSRNVPKNTILVGAATRQFPRDQQPMK